MATSVNTVTAFLAALLDVSVAEIVLTGNIDFKEYGMITETINVPGRDLIIDLNNGKTISNIYPAIDISAFYMPSGKVEIKNGFITNLMHNECTFVYGNTNNKTTEIAFNNVGFSSVSAGSTSKSMISTLKKLKFSGCSMYRKWRNVLKVNSNISNAVYESCTVYEDNSTYKNATSSSTRNATYNYCLFNGKATSAYNGSIGASASYYPYGQCNNCCIDGNYTGTFGKGDTTYVTAVRDDCVQNDGTTPCIFNATFVTSQDLENADKLLDIGLLAVQGTT